jgi:hypothetical protein
LDFYLPTDLKIIIPCSHLINYNVMNYEHSFIKKLLKKVVKYNVSSTQ